MGLTKQYLAYRSRGAFNIIASGRSNVNFIIFNGIAGRYAAVAAAENVIVWDLRLEERVLSLHRSNNKTEEVTALRSSPDRIHLAVGYADGVVEIFDMTRSPADGGEESICSMALHKSAISVLRYDEFGIRLLTGSLDTDLVVVDVIEQAGKQRLTGHKAAITDAHFYDPGNGEVIVVSSSKDTQIKLWSIATQACFKTIVDHRTEVWSLAFIQNIMVAGSGESTLSVYSLEVNDRIATTEMVPYQLSSVIDGLHIGDGDDMFFSPLIVRHRGVIQRAGKGRCVNLLVDQTERILSCHGVNNVLECFYICTEEESAQRLKKRIKKAKKAQRVTEMETKENDEAEDMKQPIDCSSSLSDEFIRLPVLRTGHKIKSLDLLYGKQKNELRLVLTLANNCIQLFGVDVAPIKEKIASLKDLDLEYKMLRTITRPGHQSEVRTVCFTSDSLAIGSGSAESFKIWNLEKQLCLRTAQTDYILCSMFVPGDRYILLGMKSGKLLIVDVGLGEIMEEIPAHEKELWSIVSLPDKKGCVTGSSDATVKLWSYALIDAPMAAEATNTTTTINSSKRKEVEGEEKKQDKDENVIIGLDGIGIGRKVLSLLHSNTLKFKESVLCVQVSPDMKYLAVGSLDATVQIYFLDTFKFFVSLYGHKMPVLSLDISYDSRLIVTGSADRNVKIWGMDFGDCHRSLFAHDDSVMCVQFIPKTHMFFSCGKDGQIKQWDADNFEKILTLPGHLGEAYSLAVSPNGEFLVSCGSDRTLRLYQRTDEILVLADVQEEERDQMDNQQLATGEDHSVPLLPGIKLASRKTVGAEKAAEELIECLHIYRQLEMEVSSSLSANAESSTGCLKLAIKPLPENMLHPMMRALQVNNVTDFLLSTLRRIRTSELEEALLLLPFDNICDLLQRILPAAIHRSSELELLCHVVFFIFKIHSWSIASKEGLKPTLRKLLSLLHNGLNVMKDDVGYNYHSLGLMQQLVEEREGVELFQEAIDKNRKGNRKRREQERQLKRQLLQLS